MSSAPTSQPDGIKRLLAGASYVDDVKDHMPDYVVCGLVAVPNRERKAINGSRICLSAWRTSRTPVTTVSHCPSRGPSSFLTSALRSGPRIPSRGRARRQSNGPRRPHQRRRRGCGRHRVAHRHGAFDLGILPRDSRLVLGIRRRLTGDSVEYLSRSNASGLTCFGWARTPPFPARVSGCAPGDP